MSSTEGNVSSLAHNGSSTDTGDRFPSIIIIQITLYIVISIIGTAGNTLVCYAISRCKRKRTNEYFILNLSITDLGASLLSIPLDVAELIEGHFPFGAFLCNLVYPFQTFVMIVSVLTLLFMSLERYRVIATPLKRRPPSTVAIAAIVSSWILALVCVVPYAIVLGFENKQCTETWAEDSHGKLFTLAMFFMFYLIPLSIITAAYINIGVALFKELRSVYELMGGKETKACDMTKRRAQQNLRMVKVFVIAVVAFACCLLPTHVLWLWHDYGTGRNYENFSVLIAFSNIMIYSNSAINPFIFGKINLRACFKFGKKKEILLGSCRKSAFILRTRELSFSLSTSFRNSFRSSTKRQMVPKKCEEEKQTHNNSCESPL